MRAYERLLNYVKVYTTSNPVSDTHPTTARQFDLARMLVKELQDLGLADAHVDEHCYVYATLPATPGHEAAKGLGFIAHMDTSPDAPGENVKPQIHENYDGGDVVLPGTGAVTRWTATKRAKSAMKTLTLPLLLSRYTASRSIRAAQRTP